MSTQSGNKKYTTEVMQSFLANAITDISTYIQMADTKVSIIMGALVALIAGALACYTPIADAISKITPCSWLGVTTILTLVALAFCVCGIFVFGILTIRGHVSMVGYESKWFWVKPTSKYSFEAYKDDLFDMTDSDVVENMAAELYKLNDINRQKAGTCKWTIRFFAATLILAGFSVALLLVAGK